MKKILLSLVSFLVFSKCFAQAPAIYEGAHRDSFSVNFRTTDTLPSRIIGDTSSVPLWQLGKTKKHAFTADTGGIHAFVTDTLHHYPVSANNWFILKLNRSYPNAIVEFWHRYETDSAHDGGAVEFSTDTGLSWTNIATCNYGFLHIYTDNIYAISDTIVSGAPAFSGKSLGEQKSRFQFFDCVGLKGTSTGCTFYPGEDIQVRFRFISDTNADTLAGWMIDSIKVINPGCVPGAVHRAPDDNALTVFPNPSYDGTFNFPGLENENQFTIEVQTVLGQKLLHGPYRQSIDLSGYPSGLYFYSATDGANYYRGRLLKE